MCLLPSAIFSPAGMLSLVTEQKPRSGGTGWWYILITLSFAQTSLQASLYILLKPQLKFVLSPGSIETVSKGQLHTCGCTVRFSAVEFFSQAPHLPHALLSAALFSWDGFGMGMSGGGVEGDWSRITAVNEWGLSGYGPCSCLLSSALKGGGGQQLGLPGAKLPSL